METLLKNNTTLERNGIYVAKEISERTVWDALAKENPTHAVISATDEHAARLKSEPQIADIKKYVSEASVLLDLGCGYGRVAQYLLPTQTLKRYIGVDSSYEMLQLFKQRHESVTAEQSTPVLFVNADIHTLPLIDQSVDVVIVSAVFLHNHKSVVQRALEEVKRVMRPGATLLVYSSFPRGYTLMGMQGNVYQGILNLLGKPMKNGPVRYYSKRELKKLLSDFSTVTYVPDGFTLLPKTIIFLPSVLERIYRLGIANPINKLFEKILPLNLRQQCAMHFDIVAKR